MSQNETTAVIAMNNYNRTTSLSKLLVDGAGLLTQMVFPCCTAMLTCCINCLLDLSAAFNSVDHNTLLCRLRISYGLRGVCFDWFKSYLSGRTQYVRSTSTCSEISKVQYGVPQGSVLGPILFLLYIADLLQLVRGHHLTPHAYADDLQRYTANADLLMLSVCRTACLHVWTKWQVGWWPTGCSLITPSPKCSGAHQHVISTRSQVVSFVLEAQPCNPYPLYTTLGLCWMPKSP